MNRSLARAVVVLVVMIGLAVDAHAGGKETMVGLKQMTVIAGPPLPATTFRVVQGGDRIEYNDEVYQWDPGTGRYQAVLGMAYGWIELNPIGDGDGGFQYQPPGGATGTAGAYAHTGS